ncbi:hypothetical protein V8E52_005349 [Russula decolorans]
MALANNRIFAKIFSPTMQAAVVQYHTTKMSMYSSLKWMTAWFANAKSSSNSATLVPDTLDPAAVKLLIEKRDAIFSKAVDELIEAFSDAEDPVALLVASAQKHIHLNTASVGLTSRGSYRTYLTLKTGNLSTGSLRNFRNRSGAARVTCHNIFTKRRDT